MSFRTPTCSVARIVYPTVNDGVLIAPWLEPKSTAVPIRRSFQAPFCWVPDKNMEKQKLLVFPTVPVIIPISLVIQDIPLLNVDPQYRKMSKSSNDGIQHTLISTVSMFKKISG